MAHRWHPVANDSPEGRTYAQDVPVRAEWRGAATAYIYLYWRPSLLHAGSP